MNDDWYDYQTWSTLGYNESNITEYTEKENDGTEKTKYNLQENCYDGLAIWGLVGE